MDFINSLVDTVKNNPLLTAGIGLGSAGIITFWFKDFPKILYNFIKQQLTTELTVSSQNSVFHDLMRWIEKEYQGRNFRKLKLSNGQWGYDADAIISIGYGVHWIRYKRTYLLINMAKESANQTQYDKDSISIMKWGRSRKIFDTLMQEIKDNKKDNSKTEIFKMSDGWIHVKDQKKRSMDSIYIEKDKKDQLINILEKFISSEQWYIDHGIPYQLGILLYGSPGTGKTSLIKAIAAYLNYPIYYLSPSKLYKIENAMSELSDKCLMVIEDIDSNTSTHAREEEQSKEDNEKCITVRKSESDKQLMQEFSLTSLSEILNSIDGMFSAHGRILIATTNHIENLDPALIRPGRIDLRLEIGFVSGEILQEFLKKFYGTSNTKFKDEELKSNITVAMLQNLVLQGKTKQDIINFMLREVS